MGSGKGLNKRVKNSKVLTHTVVMRTPSDLKGRNITFQEDRWENYLLQSGLDEDETPIDEYFLGSKVDPDDIDSTSYILDELFKTGLESYSINEDDGSEYDFNFNQNAGGSIIVSGQQTGGNKKKFDWADYKLTYEKNEYVNRLVLGNVPESKICGVVDLEEKDFSLSQSIQKSEKTLSLFAKLFDMVAKEEFEGQEVVLYPGKSKEMHTEEELLMSEDLSDFNMINTDSVNNIDKDTPEIKEIKTSTPAVKDNNVTKTSPAPSSALDDDDFIF